MLHPRENAGTVGGHFSIITVMLKRKSIVTYHAVMNIIGLVGNDYED